MVKRKRTIGQTKLYRETSRRVWRYQRGNQNPYIEKRTNNTMAKRKSTKGQTTINKTYI